MPRLIDTRADAPMALDAYIAHVEDHVVLEDPDSVIESAWALRALAHTPGLLARHLAQELRDWPLFQARSEYIGRSFILGRGRDFYVRANVWTPHADEQVGFYEIPHNHPFSFLTVGYWGPGYETDVWELAPGPAPRVGGTLPEVPWQRLSLPPGQVMYYQAERDFHIQRPPPSVSITLNLMLVTPEARLRDQLFLDAKGTEIVQVGRITPPALALATWLASELGDPCLRDPLDALGTRHPSPTVRRHAQRALARLDAPSSHEEEG